ncbi:hypothetical protein PoB_003396100 [Plakobranchus ocellatus]|uniref:Uncharacterized protein n=1 Tax=Plakobranchus ocellatus TaxID=259542 RepID=A0AAV4ALJ2_9GAST|nr:hypothetical protein PoB_003396100 [Plakobranchus ocellatus]
MVTENIQLLILSRGKKGILTVLKEWRGIQIVKEGGNDDTGCVQRREMDIHHPHKDDDNEDYDDKDGDNDGNGDKNNGDGDNDCDDGDGYKNECINNLTSMADWKWRT